MSTFTFITTFSEVELDKDGNIIADYEINLPHHDMITAEAERSWNKMKMEQYYDGILTGKVESARMKCRKTKDGISEAVIKIKMNEGVRLTQKYRDVIVSQTSAQLSDGWGECFFGYANIMTDGEKKFFVE